LPMLGACFVAMLVPILLRNAPIYDSLRERILQRDRNSSQASLARPYFDIRYWTKVQWTCFTFFTRDKIESHRFSCLIFHHSKRCL
jgi:hypothetical protein